MALSISILSRLERHLSGNDQGRGKGRDQLRGEREGMTGLLLSGAARGLQVQARIWLGVLVGSTIGGFVPALWGADLLSYSALLLSTAGAFVGLWVGYKLS